MLPRNAPSPTLPRKRKREQKGFVPEASASYPYRRRTWATLLISLLPPLAEEGVRWGLPYFFFVGLDFFTALAAAFFFAGAFFAATFLTGDFFAMAMVFAFALPVFAD
jgi:hypothetical protein